MSDRSAEHKRERRLHMGLHFSAMTVAIIGLVIACVAIAKAYTDAGHDDIADGAVRTAELADLAVSAPKLADGAVSKAKLGNDSVDGNKLDDTADFTMNSLTLSGTLNAYKSKVVKLVGTADGTMAAPNKTLTSSETGATFIVDTGTYTYVAILPTPSVGLEYTFMLDILSFGEVTKDFILSSHATGTFIVGTGVMGGTVKDFGSTNERVQFDSSAGVAGPGDRITVVCDGVNWYVKDLSVLTNTNIVVATRNAAFA